MKVDPTELEIFKNLFHSVLYLALALTAGTIMLTQTRSGILGLLVVFLLTLLRRSP